MSWLNRACASHTPVGLCCWLVLLLLWGSEVMFSGQQQLLECFQTRSQHENPVWTSPRTVRHVDVAAGSAPGPPGETSVRHQAPPFLKVSLVLNVQAIDKGASSILRWPPRHIGSWRRWNFYFQQLLWRTSWIWQHLEEHKSAPSAQTNIHPKQHIIFCLEKNCLKTFCCTWYCQVKNVFFFHLYNVKY